MIVFVMLIAFAGISAASENNVVTGVVKVLEADKIVVIDSENNEHTFAITEDTGVSEDIDVGGKVSVESTEGQAVNVDALPE